MSNLNTIISILAAVVLFVFSLTGFSNELKNVGADKLSKWLSNLTRNRVYGFLAGVFITAIIQSSSAVSSITVALIDAGVISFANSLSILIGANVGTTFTAWLVAFKISNLGSILIVLGTLISILPFRINLAGKSVFYLGLILFSLEQISYAIKGISNNELFLQILAYSNYAIIGILAGALLTAIIQSSSVITGLVIILSQQDLIGLYGAIAVIIGSNLGTTSTALIAAIKFKEHAKKAAKANVFFNLTGILMFVPFLSVFTNIVNSFNVALPYKIAIAHLLFNTITALVFLLFLNHLAKWLQRL
ncbi:MAG: Na/Pi cotransporter family protein [Bacteroidia bacterium]